MKGSGSRVFYRATASLSFLKLLSKFSRSVQSVLVCSRFNRRKYAWPGADRVELFSVFGGTSLRSPAVTQLSEMLFYFDVPCSAFPISCSWLDTERGHLFSVFEGLHPPLVYFAPSGLENRLVFVEGLTPR